MVAGIFLLQGCGFKNRGQHGRRRSRGVALWRAGRTEHRELGTLESTAIHKQILQKRGKPCINNNNNNNNNKKQEKTRTQETSSTVHTLQLYSHYSKQACLDWSENIDMLRVGTRL